LSTEKPEEEGTPPAAPATAPTVEQMLAQLIREHEEDRKKIDMLAQAIVEVNKKAEGKASQGNPSGGTDALSVIAQLVAPKGGTTEDFAKQAESFVRISESLDRFRNPSRIGLGEALLMRAGLRAIYPRYMTKAEIEKAEKALGTWEALEEKEGETEHVT